jgi:hypothetical protein
MGLLSLVGAVVGTGVLLLAVLLLLVRLIALWRW